MLDKHLTQLDLARRWRLSPRTLERWRWIGEGPQFLKVGKRICYRLEDVEAHEAQNLHTTTTDGDRSVVSPAAPRSEP